MKPKDQQFLEEAYEKLSYKRAYTMCEHNLKSLKDLIRSYFSDELQNDETPIAAKKRQTLKQEILKIVS